MYPESDHVSPPPSAHPSPTRAQPGSLPPAASPTGHPLHTESGNGTGRCSTRRPSPSLGLHSHGSLRLHLPPTLALRGSAPAVPFARRALLQAPLGFLTPRLMFSVHTTEQRGHSPRFPAPSRMYCFILITLALFHICSLPSSPLERRLPDGRNYVLFIAESLAPRTGLRTGLVLSISGMNALISSSNKVILFGLIGKMKLGEGQGQLRVPQWTPGAVLVGTPTSHPGRALGLGAAGPSSPPGTAASVSV